jgi:hypothetical protein
MKKLSKYFLLLILLTWVSCDQVETKEEINSGEAGYQPPSEHDQESKINLFKISDHINFFL